MSARANALWYLLAAAAIAACDSTPVGVPACGNGIIETGEECDGTNLGSLACPGAGVIACAADCTADTSGCAAVRDCGNGVIEANEKCEGSDLGGATCGNIGYAGGTLACDDTCEFDTTGCCTDKCVGATTRCTGEVVEVCRTNGDGCLEWAADSDCAAIGANCDISSGTAECVAACGETCLTEGEQRCAGDVINGDVVEACTRGSTNCLGWAVSDDCNAAGEFCVAPTLTTAACSATCADRCSTNGASQCAGDVVQTCRQQPSGCHYWIDVNDCASAGDLCDDTSGTAACVPCINECPTGGVSLCNGTLVEDCVVGPKGCFQISPGSDCAVSGNLCDDSSGSATCVACLNQCPATGASRCNGRLIENCARAGSGCLEWATGIDCSSSGDLCDDTTGSASCVPRCTDNCGAGDPARCNGDLVEVCATNTLGCLDWTAGADCTSTGEFCDATSGVAACACNDNCAASDLPRCSGDVIQDCTVQTTGCYDWSDGAACTDTGEVCYAAAGAAGCIAAVGEDCTNPVILGVGVNVVQWTARNQDYLNTRPSCVINGIPTGPDVVFEYTATFDGFVDFSLDKDANNRLAMVISDAACGTVSELRCVTDLTNATMGGNIAVVNGTTYTLYLVDTSSGTATLPNPVNLTVTETLCVDTCFAAGATRCTGNTLEACTLSGLGCLEWTQSSTCPGEFCNDGSGTARCLACEDTCPAANDTRCNGSNIEKCTVQTSGCTDWVGTLDCSTISLAVCDDTMATAACVLSTGEDCSSAYVLTGGVNSVSWTASNVDYLVTTPSCASSGSVTGPDVVLRYTAIMDGYIDISLAKPTSTRYAMVVSDGACGTLTPQVSCISDFTNPTMGDLIPVTLGTTYYFYLSDTTSGGNALQNPFDLTITELACIDSCSNVGAVRCTGDVVETCATSPLGCLAWLPTADCAATGGACDTGSGVAQCIACRDKCSTSGLEQCNGNVVETCTASSLGCLDWLTGADCAPLAQACFANGGSARCAVPTGEDCSSPWTLSPGANSVDWVAFNRDYLTISPSCQSAGAVAGPDVVLEYTAQTTGYADMVLGKPADQRYTLVVSGTPCGAVSSELACASNRTAATATATFAVTAGTTYYAYVVATTDGTTPLLSPFDLGVYETSCPGGMAGNDCSFSGETSCEGSSTHTRAPAAPIPDNGGDATTCGGAGTFASDVITTTQTDLITDVNVGFDITHTYDGDLDIFLEFVDSTSASHCVELSTNNGGSGNNYTNTVLDDEAATAITAGSVPFTGAFIPEAALSAFDGLTMAGTWTLFVSDDAGGDTGTLDSWTLTVEHGGGTVIQDCILDARGCFVWSTGIDCGNTGDWCAAASGTAQCLPCQDTCSLDGITQCNGNVLETCGVNPLGCYDWGAPLDCTTASEFCDGTLGIPACVTPFAEDCTNPAPLTLGPNTVAWAAINQDYLTAAPSCQTTGSPVGPDVVMEYTANYDGQLRFDINKPANMRYSTVVSDAACGTVNELACVSEVANGSMGTTFAVNDGTTYTFYVTDTDSGTDPLAEPLTVNLSCIDACTAGAQRCLGDLIQTCGADASGCLGWLVSRDCSLPAGDTCDPGGGTPVCAICTDLCAPASDTRCNGGAVETCAPGVLGCLDWSVTDDCPTTGRLCDPTASPAYCYFPVAEDCASAVVLTEGVNTVNWVAFSQDYVPATLSCQGSSSSTGPDLVFAYTAQADGFLDLTMDKLGNQRFTYIVSDATCGTLTPQVACVSDSSSTSMGGLLPIVGGTTYYVYVTDTTSGGASLVNPVTLTVAETTCPSGAAGDLCPGEGITACSGLVNQESIPNPPLAIPDDAGNATTCGSVAASVVDSIVVSQASVIADVNAGINITHTWTGDLDIFLEFVDGTSTSHCVELSTNNGGSGNNYTGTIFDDEATASITTALAPLTGSFVPESPLSALNGLPMNGTWTIFVSDDARGDTGTLDSWSLEISPAAGSVIDTCTLQSGCLAWQSGTDCAATGENCNAASGAAVCLPCQDTCPRGGASHCAGTVIEDCLVNGQGCYDWSTGTDCAGTSKFCLDSGGSAACVPCLDTCANAGDKQCNGAVVEMCGTGALGCLDWLVDTDCGATNQDCDASSGTAACTACTSSCNTPGATQCAVAAIATSAPSTPIPDNGGDATTCGGATTFATDVISVAQTDPINDVDVTINVSHTWDSDVDIFLGFVDNTGTAHCVELTTDNGGLGDDYLDTIFDDEATTSITSGSAPFTGRFRPETPLSDLDGLPMNGNYTLYLSDAVLGDTGTLNDWTLRVSYGMGTVIETCVVQPNSCMAWNAGTDCSVSLGVCDDSSGTAVCAACVDTCPSAGATRCNGALAEDCAIGALGCLEWSVGSDCNALNPGDICDDSTGAAVCMTPLGENCSTPYPLTFGANVVNWFASSNDYLTAAPSCQYYGTPDGPDIVLEYTAEYSGALDISIAKPSGDTQTFVVSDATCGTLTPQLSCASSWWSPSMNDTIPVTLGTTYTIYVIDSTDGSSPLNSPLSVTLGCIDGCTGGERRCTGDTIETCLADAFGCLSWQMTTDCSLNGDTCDSFSGTPLCAPCATFCAVAGTTQCNANIIETCTVGALGCNDWVGGTNCTPGGDVCIDISGTATCVTPAGEDCSNTFVLSQGVNTVVWSAVSLDYLTSPSCTYSGPTGPDVVAQYTATSSGTGFVDVVMDKPASTRYAMVVSSATCGVTTEHACYSEYTNPTMGGTFTVSGGTTYYFYVVDTTSGSGSLTNPFTLTLNEADCAFFSATPSNEFPINGATTASLRPVLSVDFDVAIDSNFGLVTIAGDHGTNLSYSVATSSEVYFTNGGTTINIDPGIAFPPGEQLSIAWSGLRDLVCGGTVNSMTWEFVIAVPTCMPGAGGMVGNTTLRVPTSVSGFSENYVAADASPGGWVYVGGTSTLYRAAKGGSTVEDVELLAGLGYSQLGYAMLVVGRDVFTLDDTAAAAGRLWRLSTDGGQTWNVEDYAGFAQSPADEFDAVAYNGGRIYMMTNEYSSGVDTEIWSVSATAGSLPDSAVLETTFAEYDCNALALDDFFYYAACAGGDRVLRVDRSTGTVALLTATYNLSSLVNALHVHDLTGNGVADVLYLQIGTEQVFYFCDPSTAPFTDLLVGFGSGTTTSNRGLGFDATNTTLWAYDDDTQELIRIQ